MVLCEAGDVAVVPFPFTDIALAKPRPALALSSRVANDASGNTVFAMITTAARSHWPQDVVLQDGGAAGLRTRSLVRIKLFTLDNRLVAKTIGSLSTRDRKAVRAMLHELLAL